MDVQLIPAPRGLALTREGGGQSFTLDQQTTINGGPGTERAKRWLHGALTAATGLLLAAHKLNVLHLHLTDDQGWRPPGLGTTW